MIINDNQLLMDMMSDLENAPSSYRPGNYWNFYIKKIASQLLHSDLNTFRNKVLAPGSTASFGGGADLEGIKYGWNIYPFDDKFRAFDQSTLVKIYNRLINIVARYCPAVGIFAIRSSLGRAYFEDTIIVRQNAAWMVAKSYDKNGILKNIEDSGEGSPKLFIKNGKEYTVAFFSEFIQHQVIEKSIDISKVKYIVELGSGIGLKASVFSKINPEYCYCLVDIPPALYVAHQYLSAIFPGEVLHYREAVKLDSISRETFAKYRIICLPPWMMENIAGNTFDLFINVGSFQEMEPWLVKNYLSLAKDITQKYFYLSNDKEGHHKAAKEGKHGVLKQTKRNDYIDFLSPEASLIYEENAVRALVENPSANDMLFEIQKK